MKSYDDYELQVIYTQIERDKNDTPIFKDFEFNVNDSLYFYPASSVKFPIALMALEKVKELQEKEVHINRKTSFKTQNDTLYTSIEEAITKIFAVSSNQSYNRLFEFLGQDYINNNLKSKNLNGRISHRLSAFHAQNLKTQSIQFKNNPDDSISVYEQEAIENLPLPKLTIKRLLKGKGYIYNDTLIPQPKDFSENNYLPLRSLHDIMKRVQFPEKYSASERFDIKPDDYAFVLKAMSLLPQEVGYDKKTYYDSYSKFFMYGDTKNDIPKNIRIYNKVGSAYGYLTDCSYIKDTHNTIEFMISATIHVNKNGIYNDDNYEYFEVGIPFLAQLGREIYQLEKREQ
ncbi:hypothetical protein GCM10022259_09190 [Aquimarina mytili]